MWACLVYLGDLRILGTFKTFALIVTPHPYSARKFTRHVINESMCWVIKWTMIQQMAITIALPGFNDLVTPIFLLMDHFLYLLSTSREKMKKIYRLEVWFFFYKMRPRNPFLELFAQRTHFYKLWLRSFAFVDSPSIFLTINPYRSCWSSFPHALVGDPPIFFACLTQETHYLTAVKS